MPDSFHEFEGAELTLMESLVQYDYTRFGTGFTAVECNS